MCKGAMHRDKPVADQVNLELDKKTRINLEKARVLLLEPDNPGTDILTQVFFGFGVRQPVRCPTVDVAMEQLASEIFELVVVDGDLEDGLAYDFVARLRASQLEPNRYVPVIVLSGHTPDALVQRARDCGANFVVTKPLRPMVLLERIFWVCMETRTFLELDGYIGPDRRFQFLGPPIGMAGRRRGDEEELGKASSPNLTQDEINNFLSPTKAKL
jgi:CheY-like chemotaxis protein